MKLVYDDGHLFRLLIDTDHSFSLIQKYKSKKTYFSQRMIDRQLNLVLSFA